MEDMATSRYRKVRLLGQGAMGLVYLVHDPVLEREVALKEVLDPAVGLAEFKQEFWWMTRLRHPHLVEVFHFGVSEEGHPFFTMEVVEGRPLDLALPLAPAAAREVLKQLCGVLGHLHRAGLVHGDIKPENMRLQRDGTLKLMDFGLMTQAGQVAGVRGTPAYMAPEVIRGGRVDRRADLYALGALTYQLLTGRLPFEAPDRGTLLEAHLDTPAPAPSELVPGLEPIWDRVVLRLLEKEPVRRFQSARDVLEALGETTEDDQPDLLSPPFVGRESALGQFDASLKELGQEPRLASLAIGGPAGIGKSRLLDEFAFRAQLAQRQVLRGRVSAGAGVPYEAFAQVLRQAWPLLKLSDQGQRALLAASLRSMAPDLGPDATGEDDSQRMEPQQEKQRLQSAFADVLRYLSRQQGVVLLLDNWQDADPLSIELLGVLKRQLASEALQITLATQRPDEQALVLEPLAGDELARMLGAMLGEESVPEAFLAPIAEITGGVPEAVEAVLRHLVAHRLLPREGGRWRLGALPAGSLPSGVHEILSARLAELSPLGRRIMELAAVIQGECSVPLLARLLPDTPGEALYAELADLVQQQWLAQDKESVRPAQAHLASALREGLGDERLRQLHTQVGEALEELEQSEGASGQGSDALVLRLAHHFLAGVRQAKAVLYALKAAKRADALYANELAMELANGGWAWLNESSPSLEGLEHLRPEYLSLMGDLNRRKGDFVEAARCYDEGLPLAAAQGRADIEGRMLVGAGVVKQMQKDYPGALALFERALPVCRTLANPRDELRGLTAMARTYYQSGNQSQAEATYQRALARAREAGHPTFEGESLAFLGLIWVSNEPAEGQPSRVTEGLAMFQQSIVVKQRIGDKIGLNDTYMLLGNAQMKLGDLAGAGDSFARNWALCEETGALDDGVFAHLNLTIVAIDRGDPAAALAHIRKALELATAVKADFSWGLGKSLEGLVLLHHGRPAGALAASEEAVAHARGLKNRYLELFALVYALEIEVGLGRWQAAQTVLEAALQLQAESGVNEYAKSLALNGARLALQQGRQDEARQAFEALWSRAQAKGAKLLAAQAALGLAQAAPAIALATRAAEEAEACGAQGLLAEAHMVLSQAHEAAGQPESALAQARSAVLLAERWQLQNLLVRACHRLAVLESPSAQANRRLKQAQQALHQQLDDLSEADKAEFLAAFGRQAVMRGELSEGASEAGASLSGLKRQLGEALESADMFKKQREGSRRILKAADPERAMALALELVLALTQASRAEVLLKEGKRLNSALRIDAPDQPACHEDWNDHLVAIERAIQAGEPIDGSTSEVPGGRSYWVLPLTLEGQMNGAVLVLAPAQGLTQLTPEAQEAVVHGVDSLEVALRTLRVRSDGKRLTERFQMLNELGRAVGSSLELEQVLRVLLEQTLNLTQASLAYVILPEDDQLVCRYGLDASGESVTGLQISYTLANRVLGSREPLCILDTGAEEGSQTASVLALNIQSVMCVPMIVKDELVGLLYVSSNYVTRTFTQQDLELLIAIAGQTALSVQNALYLAEMEEKKRIEAELGRIGQEMEIATRIQTALLPNDLAIQGFELAMELRTATEVGGDLIDYIPQEDGRFWLAVGDVTGHGLTPGLIMMMSQSLFSGLAMTDPEMTPAALLIRLNRALYHNVRNRLGNDNYLTLQLVRHEGDGHFSVSGLHCDLLIYRAAEQRVERMETPGFWTGFLDDVTALTHEARFRLDPDDVLLLYTDGLIEAKDAAGVQFDMQRLEQALARHASLSAEAIKARLLEEVQAWLCTVDDDMSLVVLKRQP